MIEHEKKPNKPKREKKQLRKKGEDQNRSLVPKGLPQPDHSMNTNKYEEEKRQATW